MEGMLTKASSFLLARRAKKEMNSIGDDFNALSTSVETSTRQMFNRLRGRMQTPLPDLLQKHGLPRGLFPRNATHYEYDETTGKLTVMLPFMCESCFRDNSILRYAATVTATLQNGKLVDIEGLKTKVLIWVKVTAISVNDPPNDKVYFSVGVKKSRPKEAYEVLKDGLEVDEF